MRRGREDEDEKEVKKQRDGREEAEKWEGKKEGKD
jgi:hypothetical protein